jgi:hypothetical protein
MIAEACSAPPEGRARWTRKLWADQLVPLDLVDTIRTAWVHTSLTKPRSTHGRSSG